MNTLLFLALAAYLLSAFFCARYYFYLVTRYEGVSVGRGISSFLLTTIPIVNTLTVIAIIWTIFDDVFYELSVYGSVNVDHVIERKGLRINEALGMKYHPQEDWYVLRLFRLLWSLRQGIRAILNFKIVQNS